MRHPVDYGKNRILFSQSTQALISKLVHLLVGSLVEPPSFLDVPMLLRISQIPPQTLLDYEEKGLSRETPYHQHIFLGFNFILCL